MVDVSNLDSRIQEKAQNFANVCKAYGYDLNINYLSKDEANFILDIMGYYWNQMSGNEEVQKETHRIANQLRKSVGIPVED